MPKDMLGSVVRAAVGVPQDRMDVLAKVASAMAADNPAGRAWHELFKAQLKEGLSSAEVEAKKLLEFLRTISFPAVDNFVAAEKFRECETVDGIRVAWLGNNFKANFLKKVEKSVPALEMREHKLDTGSRDPAIITELGGEKQVETFLSHFWEFLKTADQTLWHVRYIRDVNGVLWAVRARWTGGGLDVEALSLGRPFDWDAGGRFLSR